MAMGSRDYVKRGLVLLACCVLAILFLAPTSFGPGRFTDVFLQNVKSKPLLSTNALGQVVDGSTAVAFGGSPWWDVTHPNYGADSTGGVDSSDEIQAAIDACSAAGGGIVFLPKGTYLISDNDLTIKSECKIMGAGEEATILDTNGAARKVFKTPNLSGIKWWSIERMTITDLNSPGSPTANSYGIYLDDGGNMNHWMIKDVRIAYMNYGIFGCEADSACGGNDNTIMNTLLRFNDFGFKALSKNWALRFINFQAANNNDTAVWIGSESSSFIGGFIGSSVANASLILEGAHNITFDQTYFESDGVSSDEIINIRNDAPPAANECINIRFVNNLIGGKCTSDYLIKFDAVNGTPPAKLIHFSNMFFAAPVIAIIDNNSPPSAGAGIIEDSNFQDSCPADCDQVAGGVQACAGGDNWFDANADKWMVRNAFSYRTEGGQPGMQYITTSGRLEFASVATGSFDTNLYSSAADTLTTDDSVSVGTDLTVTGNTNLSSDAYHTPSGESVAFNYNNDVDGVGSLQFQARGDGIDITFDQDGRAIFDQAAVINNELRFDTNLADMSYDDVNNTLDIDSNEAGSEIRFQVNGTDEASLTSAAMKATTYGVGSATTCSAGISYDGTATCPFNDKDCDGTKDSGEECYVTTDSSVDRAMYWGAGAISVDAGLLCNAPAEVTIGSWSPMYTIICDNNDGSSMYGSAQMPDTWDAGNVNFKLSFIQDGAGTGVVHTDVAARCVGSGETPAAYGTERAMDSGTVAGLDAMDTVNTSTAVTPTGTCAAGDFLQWRIQIDAAGTTTAVATLNFVGVRMEYSGTVTE